MAGGRFHVDRLVPHLGLRLRRAHIHAHAASCAVVGRDLDRHCHTGHVLRPEGLGLEPVRRGRQLGRVVHLHPDRRVRAHGRTAPAVDADVSVEDRDFLRDRALLVLGCARRKDAVDRERRHGQQITVACEQHRRDPLHELGGIVGDAVLARVVAVTVSGTSTRRSAASDASIAAKLRSTIASHRVAYAFSIPALMKSIACSAGRTPTTRRSRAA